MLISIHKATGCVDLQDGLLDTELLLAPGFPAPPNMDYTGYHKYIDDALPDESPYLYGLHPNAEIGFLTTASETLFRTVFEMQPRDSGAAGASTVTREEKVCKILYTSNLMALRAVYESLI
jgi:dynein heavy chain